MHLAWAEGYAVIDMAFRRMDLGLWETDERDVRMAREYFVPLA